MGVSGFQRAVVKTLVDDAGVVSVSAIESDVRRFVEDGLRAMPIHMRIGVGSVAALLAVGSRARHGRAFRRLGPEERLAVLRAWDSSRFGPAHQYVRLIRSLTLFAAFEHPSAALGQ